MKKKTIGQKIDWLVKEIKDFLDYHWFKHQFNIKGITKILKQEYWKCEFVRSDTIMMYRFINAELRYLLLRINKGNTYPSDIVSAKYYADIYGKMILIYYGRSKKSLKHMNKIGLKHNVLVLDFKDFLKKLYSGKIGDESICVNFVKKGK